jgi:hypothetical protein
MKLRRGQILGPNRDDLAMLYIVLRDIGDEDIKRAFKWERDEEDDPNEEPQFLKIEAERATRMCIIEKSSLGSFSLTGLTTKLKNNKPIVMAEENRLRNAIKFVFKYELRVR